ncbi:MAG: hypothetical protein Q4B22_09495 [Eubacteriales bacterium]|nr:hypothetical protein [Eubacteriales bacterium]
MTQEEYEREQAEIARLTAQIEMVRAENNRLVAEINEALSNISVLQRNIEALDSNLKPKLQSASAEVEVNDTSITALHEAIAEMSRQYFTYKELSTATKTVTQKTEEYYSRFSFYNNLRRVTLGYVIGLDSNFVTQEKMRNMVEKVYLQNTDYWLAYASMAMMLWASYEKEAAERALEKALFMNQQKAALFFMLVNLRFTREDAAQKWFVDYMNRVNPGDLGEEWQYLLQAYLSGAFGSDAEFQTMVGDYFRKMLVQTETTTADFQKRFTDGAVEYADTYLHTTKETFAYLKGACAEYGQLIDSLSCAEKNALLAAYYDELNQREEEPGEEIPQRVENVLYALINDYDDAEYAIVKEIRRSEMIIAAQGDTTAAAKKFEAEFGKPEKKNFADLMAEWAFADDVSQTPLCVRRFSISFTKDWILHGYEKYAESYREKEKWKYLFNIDGCEITCSENEYPQGQQAIEAYYEKNKWKGVFSDKMTLIYGLITLLGLTALIIMGVLLTKGSFSPVALIFGLLMVLAGVFLLWRQIVAILEEQKEKRRLSMQRFRHTLDELREWRNLYHREDDRFGDLVDALNRFGNGEK